MLGVVVLDGVQILLLFTLSLKSDWTVFLLVSEFLISFQFLVYSLKLFFLNPYKQICSIGVISIFQTGYLCLNYFTCEVPEVQFLLPLIPTLFPWIQGAN